MGSLVKRSRELRKRQIKAQQKSSEEDNVKTPNTLISTNNDNDEIQRELVLPTAGCIMQSQFTPHFARSGLPLSRIDMRVSDGCESRLQPSSSSALASPPRTEMTVRVPEPYPQSPNLCSLHPLSPPPVLTPQVHFASHNRPTMGHRSELVAILRREIADLRRERFALRQELRQQQLTVLALRRSRRSPAALRRRVRPGEIMQREAAENATASSTDVYGDTVGQPGNAVHASSLMECSNTSMDVLEFEVGAEEQDHDITTYSASRKHYVKDVCLPFIITETRNDETQNAMNTDSGHQLCKGDQNSSIDGCQKGSDRFETASEAHSDFIICKQESNLSLPQSEIERRAQCDVKFILKANNEFQVGNRALMCGTNMNGDGDVSDAAADLAITRTQKNLDHSLFTIRHATQLSSEGDSTVLAETTTFVESDSSDIGQKRNIDVDGTKCLLMRPSSTSENSSYYSSAIRIMVQERTELPVEETGPQSEIFKSELEKMEPVDIGKKLFVVDANRLIELFKLCPRCGYLVKYVDLSHTDAVPNLIWECNGNCGISQWSGRSSE